MLSLFKSKVFKAIKKKSFATTITQSIKPKWVFNLKQFESNISIMTSKKTVLESCNSLLNEIIRSDKDNYLIESMDKPFIDSLIKAPLTVK